MTANVKKRGELITSLFNSVFDLIDEAADKIAELDSDPPLLVFQNLYTAIGATCLDTADRLTDEIIAEDRKHRHDNDGAVTKLRNDMQTKETQP